MPEIISITAEKEKLTHALSEQYSKNLITMEEYEKMLDWVNRVETGRELMAVKTMVYYDSKNAEVNYVDYEKSELDSKETKKGIKKTKDYVSVFSSQNVSIKPTNGKAGTFTSVLGSIQVTIDDLPKGKTVLMAEAVFGLIEVLVPRHIRVINKAIPVFGGVFASNDVEQVDYEGERPELHIVGEAVFGSITIVRI